MILLTAETAASQYLFINFEYDCVIQTCFVRLPMDNVAVSKYAQFYINFKTCQSGYDKFLVVCHQKRYVYS